MALRRPSILTLATALSFGVVAIPRHTSPPRPEAHLVVESTSTSDGLRRHERHAKRRIRTTIDAHPRLTRSSASRVPSYHVDIDLSDDRGTCRARATLSTPSGTVLAIVTASARSSGDTPSRAVLEAAIDRMIDNIALNVRRVHAQRSLPITGTKRREGWDDSGTARQRFAHRRGNDPAR